MKRYVLLLAFAGVLIVPEGASAFFRPWCSPPPYMPFGYGFGFGFGRYAAPFYPQFPQFAYPPFYAPQAVPFCEVPQPARGYPTIPPAFAPRTQVPVAPTHAPIVTITPGVPPLARPEADPLVRPATSGIATPMAAPAPMTPLTIPDPMVPKTAPFVSPPLPGSSDSKPVPSASPSPAPASPGLDLPLSIPLPEPRKVPGGGKEELPPLVLPPEGAGGPSGVIPNTSRSSPLTGAIKVQVFAAGGTIANASIRKIGFFNHTDRDLDLVIEGRAVKLPKKSFLHAEMPVKFTWKHSDRPAELATVPDGAAGLDVLFKE